MGFDLTTLADTSLGKDTLDRSSLTKKPGQESETYAGPAAGRKMLDEALRGGGPKEYKQVGKGRNARIVQTGIGRATMSAADLYKPGGIGDQLSKQMEGKPVKEQLAIAAEAQATEDKRRAQGVAQDEFYRNRNADGSIKPLTDRVAATGINGLKSEADRIASVKGSGLWKGQTLPAGVTPEQQIAKNATPVGRPLTLPVQAEISSNAQRANDQRNLATNGTIAVDPRYAGPGQLTTDTTRDASGKLVNAVKPGAPAAAGAPIQYAGPDGPKTIPTEFKQGFGNVPTLGVPAIASTNPTGRPLASLADGSFLGGGNNVPSLYDNPAVTQADKTVNGVNRSGLMDAFKSADAQQKSGASVPAVTTAKKPASEEEARKKFAAPIKFSLS